MGREQCATSSAYRLELLAADGTLATTGSTSVAVPDGLTPGEAAIRLVCYVPDSTARRVIFGMCGRFVVTDELAAAGGDGIGGDRLPVDAQDRARAVGDRGRAIHVEGVQPAALLPLEQVGLSKEPWLGPGQNDPMAGLGIVLLAFVAGSDPVLQHRRPPCTRRRPPRRRRPARCRARRCTASPGSGRSPSPACSTSPRARSGPLLAGDDRPVLAALAGGAAVVGPQLVAVPPRARAAAALRPRSARCSSTAWPGAVLLLAGMMVGKVVPPDRPRRLRRRGRAHAGARAHARRRAARSPALRSRCRCWRSGCSATRRPASRGCRPYVCGCLFDRDPDDADAVSVAQLVRRPRLPRPARSVRRVSALGDWMGTVAFMALALELTGSPTAVGGILTLRLLPAARRRAARGACRACAGTGGARCSRWTSSAPVIDRARAARRARCGGSTCGRSCSRSRASCSCRRATRRSPTSSSDDDLPARERPRPRLVVRQHPARRRAVRGGGRAARSPTSSAGRSRSCSGSTRARSWSRSPSSRTPSTSRGPADAAPAARRAPSASATRSASRWCGRSCRPRPRSRSASARCSRSASCSCATSSTPPTPSSACSSRSSASAPRSGSVSSSGRRGQRPAACRRAAASRRIGVIVAVFSLAPSLWVAFLGAVAFGAAAAFTLAAGMGALQSQLDGSTSVSCVRGLPRGDPLRARASPRSAPGSPATSSARCDWPLVGRLEPSRVVLFCSGRARDPERGRGRASGARAVRRARRDRRRAHDRRDRHRQRGGAAPRPRRARHGITVVPMWLTVGGESDHEGDAAARASCSATSACHDVGADARRVREGDQGRALDRRRRARAHDRRQR